MDNLKIFVSHNTKYVDIAKSLKLSLQALESKTRLDVKISEEMAGATDWRQWIEENVRSADIFLLLFPHASMDIGWCNYELGRFYDGKRKIVCIKNTDIPQPPPAFQPYQAYDADEAGILKFIDELFVSGTFTDGIPLNKDVGQITGNLYERAQSVANELAQKFAQARVREQLYERRIVLSVRYDETKRFDAEASTIEGNADGLNLLGLGQVATVPWSTVRQSIGEAVELARGAGRGIAVHNRRFVAAGTLSLFCVERDLYSRHYQGRKRRRRAGGGRSDLRCGESRSAAAAPRLVSACDYARRIRTIGTAGADDVQGTVGNLGTAISRSRVSRADTRALCRNSTFGNHGLRTNAT